MKQTGGNNRGRRAAVMVAVLLLLIALGPIAAFAAEAPQKSVLVVHSYHKGYKWTDDVMAGMEQILKAEPIAATMNIQVEYLDTKRVAPAGYFEQLSGIYKQRFGSRKFDVILVSDNDALNFMLKYRDAVFPGTPVVFCGVNWFTDTYLGGQTGYTGVNEEADVKDNLKLITKVHPEAKRIVVVVDTTTTGQRVKETVLQAAAGLGAAVKVEFLDDMEMGQIVETVKTLPKNAVVLYTIFAKDKTGKFFEFNESSSMISQASAVPLYGLWDFNLGFGIVGGKLTSGLQQGRTAGELALRVLNGENVDSIPVVRKSPNKYLFDYVQLERFKIKPTLMPAESTYINKPQNTMVHFILIGIGVILLAGVVFIYKKVI